MAHPEDTDDARADADRDGCGCGAAAATDEEDGPGAGRWLDVADPLAATLPADVRTPLGRVLGGPPVATIDAWLTAVKRYTGGGAIDVESLCHADDGTPHRGTMDGDTYHFQCFYDAVALSALADEPVDVRTESPGGTVIEAHADGDELDVSPDGAVFSFGVATDATPPADGEPTLGAVYGAICPYVRAFPDRTAYEHWAETVPAATVGLPLAGGTEIAAALAE